MEDYVQAADLGLFTSDSESFCLSILEAMFFGCPSVARKVGGIPEVITDKLSGLLVDTNRAETLAGAVESLRADPGRRKALGRAAQERAREFFSAAAIVPLYEALYRRVCAGKLY
jgi:glycosyltransferase involved in cell wall biosynthesis